MIGTNEDPRLYFLIYTYITWSYEHKSIYKSVKKYEDILELEKNLQLFYKNNKFFELTAPSIEKVISTNFNCESELIEKRINSIEKFFKTLASDPDFLHPYFLNFLEISSFEQEPYLIYHRLKLKNEKPTTFYNKRKYLNS